MKSHDFYLNLTDKKGREMLFREITSIKDFLLLKLTVLELMISQWNGSCDIKTCTFPYLHIDDYSLHRVFIVSNNKIISFGFGFTIQPNSKKIEAFRACKEKITSRQISEAQSLLALCNGETLYKEIDYDDLEQTPSEGGIKLFEYLLFEESAYIRYDYDEQTKNVIMHPKHHFDICFTPNYSYKIGLLRGIEELEYAKILSKKDFCRILNLNSNRLHRGYSSRKQNLKGWKGRKIK